MVLNRSYQVLRQSLYKLVARHWNVWCLEWNVIIFFVFFVTLHTGMLVIFTARHSYLSEFVIYETETS